MRLDSSLDHEDEMTSGTCIYRGAPGYRDKRFLASRHPILRHPGLET